MEFIAGAQQSCSVIWHRCKRQTSVTSKNKSNPQEQSPPWAAPNVCVPALRAEVALSSCSVNAWC